jgi:dihydrolipoamide dehydrogenase
MTDSNSSFDLIVIGAGPGGYVAAIRAAQLGFRTACVEREYLGGTCLNVGCIPSKALLDSSERFHYAKHNFTRHGIVGGGELKLDLAKMLARKDEVVRQLTGGVGMLFRKNKIEHLKGHGRITGANTVEVKGNDGSLNSYQTKRILIATGSAPIELPGLKFDEKNILSSTGGLTIPKVPKKMILVGAGYIGLELGSVWNRLGSEVLVLEFLDRCLPPSDGEMAGLLQKSLEKQGLKFKFGTVAESAQVSGDKVKVTWKSGDQKGTEEVDKVLVCVGRRPVTDGLGLKEAGVQMDKKGFVTVDEQYTTSVPSIFAIGDVIGGVMLAHKAEEEGVACVEMMAGKAGHVNYHACPSVVYTHPELAQVGLTEEEASKRGPIKVGKFPFLANGRAKGMDETEGLVKIIGDAKTDKILGVHILGAHASDVISEAVVAVEFAASCEDLARTFHAHPTLPEAVKEAALAVDKHAIHI